MKKILSIVLVIIFSLLFIGCDACGIDGVQDEVVATELEFKEFFKDKDTSLFGGNFTINVDTEYEYKQQEKTTDAILTIECSISASGTFNFKNYYFSSAKTKLDCELTNEYDYGSSSREDEWDVTQSAVGVNDDYEEIWYYDRYTKVTENGVTTKTDELTKEEGVFSKRNGVLASHLSTISFPTEAVHILRLVENVCVGYPSGLGAYFFIDGDDCLLIESNDIFVKKTALIYDGNELKKVCVYSETGTFLIETTYEFCDYKEIKAPQDASSYN